MRPSKLIMFATMSLFVWTCLAGPLSLSVMADDTLVRFEGGIGVVPLRAGGLANEVLGVQPGGRPWVIKDLDVKVKAN